MEVHDAGAEDPTSPKVVKRRGKWTPFGRSLSLSNLSTTEPPQASAAGSRASSKISFQSALQAGGAGPRTSSKTSACPIEEKEDDAALRPPSRESTNSGKSKALQDGGRGIMGNRRPSTIEDVPSSPAKRVSMLLQQAPLRRRSSVPAVSPVVKTNGLDMSPRAQRRYSIRQHRLSLPQAMGAPDMAEKGDEGLCGFRKGDRVTTQGGPDEDGPWKNMGVGVVEGRAEAKQGNAAALLIYFEEVEEKLPIRACNLLNLTDPARSGKHMRALADEQRGPSWQKPAAVRSATTESVQTIEPTSYTGRSDLAASGLVIGDVVSSNMRGCTDVLGIVVAEGAKPGDVMVRMGDLGIRVFKRTDLIKNTSGDFEVDKAAAARRASFVDPDQKKPFALTMDDAVRAFDGPQRRVEEIPRRKDGKQIARVGDFVRMSPAADNHPTWKALGIGIVRAPGRREGTVEVQFDNGAESWTLLTEQLDVVPRHEATDRVFRRRDEAQLRRRGSI